MGKYGEILGRFSRRVLEISGTRNLVRLTGVLGPAAVWGGRKCGLLEGDTWGVGYKARSSSRSQSRSRSLGGSLRDEPDDKNPGSNSSSSRIFRVFSGSDMSRGGKVVSRIVFGCILRVGMSGFSAVQQHLDVTSSLGVSPGKSLEIKNPCPTRSDQVTRAHISIGKRSCIEISESTSASAQP